MKLFLKLVWSISRWNETSVRGQAAKHMANACFTVDKEEDDG